MSKDRHKARPRSKRPGRGRKAEPAVNPPFTVEETAGGRWRFTHAAGTFYLEPHGPNQWALRRGGKRPAGEEPFLITGCFCNSPGYPLRMALQFLDGVRAEWGNQRGYKRLWWEKLKEGS